MYWILTDIQKFSTFIIPHGVLRNNHFYFHFQSTTVLHMTKWSSGVLYFIGQEVLFRMITHVFYMVKMCCFRYFRELLKVFRKFSDEDQHLRVSNLRDVCNALDLYPSTSQGTVLKLSSSKSWHRTAHWMSNNFFQLAKTQQLFLTALSLIIVLFKCRVSFLGQKYLLCAVY